MRALTFSYRLIGEKLPGRKKIRISLVSNYQRGNEYKVNTETRRRFSLYVRCFPFRGGVVLSSSSNDWQGCVP